MIVPRLKHFKKLLAPQSDFRSRKKTIGATTPRIDTSCEAAERELRVHHHPEADHLGRGIEPVERIVGFMWRVMQPAYGQKLPTGTFEPTEPWAHVALPLL